MTKSILVDLRRHGHDCEDHLSDTERERARQVGRDHHSRGTTALVVFTDTCRTMETACAICEGGNMRQRTRYDMIRGAEHMTRKSVVKEATLHVLRQNQAIMNDGDRTLIVSHQPFVESLYRAFGREQRVRNLSGLRFYAHFDTDAEEPTLEFICDLQEPQNRSTA